MKEEIRPLRKPRIAHPLIDWSKEYVDDKGRRVIDVKCVGCGAIRMKPAAYVASEVRRGTFTGRCTEHRELVGPRLGPYTPLPNVDYTRVQLMDASGGRQRCAHVVITCPDCGKERWRMPSVIQWQVRAGVFTARCRKCQLPHNKKRNIEGRSILQSGYVLVRRDGVAPNLRPWFDLVAQQRAYGEWLMEHTVVMASMIGRALYRYETVHHKNGMRADNHPSNLRLYKRGEHHPGYGDFYQEWQEALAEIARLKATASGPRHESLPSRA